MKLLTINLEIDGLVARKYIELEKICEFAADFVKSQENSETGTSKLPVSQKSPLAICVIAQHGRGG